VKKYLKGLSPERQRTAKTTNTCRGKCFPLIIIMTTLLKALTSKRAAEVGYQLLDIFLLFGAPHILQLDNSREFTANVIKELTDLWPDCCIIHNRRGV
jgi:hypothetical protein